MAHIEIHALSVKLAGTFEAHVFFPEQEVEKAEEKFPVLWMIHEDASCGTDGKNRRREKNVCNCSDDKSFACNQYGIWHKE